jgi:hypothetical protein
VNSVKGCDGMIAGFKDLLDFIKKRCCPRSKSDASNDISPWHILTLVAISSLAALLGVAYCYPLLGHRVGLLALEELCIPHRAVGVVLPSPISVGSSSTQQAQQ